MVMCSHGLTVRSERSTEAKRTLFDIHWWTRSAKPLAKYAHSHVRSAQLCMVGLMLVTAPAACIGSSMGINQSPTPYRYWLTSCQVQRVLTHRSTDSPSSQLLQMLDRCQTGFLLTNSECDGGAPLRPTGIWLSFFLVSCAGISLFKAVAVDPTVAGMD